MITLTNKAVGKIKELLQTQPESFSGIRIQVVGGGCSGFQYSINFETQGNNNDEIIDIENFKVYVDPASLMYLENTTLDWLETLNGAGFKFHNPDVKSTCGCGESFQV